VDYALKAFLPAVMVGLVVASGGCNTDSTDVSGKSDAASRTSGSTSSGGSTGGGSSASSGGTSAAGTTGSGGASGGMGGASVGQPDALPADAIAAKGGSTGKGGSSSAGGQAGAGGQSGTGGFTGSGGQTGTGGDPPDDAGSDATPDIAVSKDVAIPDLAPIPDLPVKQDAALVFWQAGFTPNCAPPAISGRSEADGHHRPGENCMTSGCHLNPKTAHHHAGTDCRGSGCHSKGSPDGSGAPAFLFGGTAYRAVTLAADPGVEVGVQPTKGFYSACSASNGNFWYLAPSGTTSLAWAGAITRLRNANGEAPMMTAPAAGCNATLCHTGTMKITSP
jgi:hypothetical protein